jgi:hypothetical protein
MRHIKNISIPQPCNQQWQQMSLAANGRHCDVCCKTIVNFSPMTNDEVIGYLAANRSVCGRLDEQQLKVINQQFFKNNLYTFNKLKKWGVALSFLSLFNYFKANAQVKAPTVQINADTKKGGQTKLATSKKISTPNDSVSRIITGQVTDKENRPIPNAQITALPTNEKVLTNNDGNFSLNLPATAKEFRVSFIGFDVQVIAVDTTKDIKYAIKLQEAKIIMGEIVINNPNTAKKIYNKLIDTLSGKHPK